MRYDEFRDRWHDALIKAGFLSAQDRPDETVDVTTGERRWRATRLLLSQRTEPFTSSARVDFRWDPFESARSFTCEEDLLTDLLGRARSHANTEPRMLRVDIRYRAALPYGSTQPLPDAAVWEPWVGSIEDRLDSALAPGRQKGLPAWRGDLEIRGSTGEQGTMLNDVSVPAFEMIMLPRVWDDPKRRAKERGADKQIEQLAIRFGHGFEAWLAGVSELGAWLRHTPTPPPPRPRRRGGSETTH